MDGVTRIVRMSFHKHGTRENTVKGPCVCERDESVTKEVNLYICMYVYIYVRYEGVLPCRLREVPSRERMSISMKRIGMDGECPN